MSRDDGAASIQALVVLCLMGAIIAASSYAIASSSRIALLSSGGGRDPEMLKLAASIVDAIQADSSPGADSPDDLGFSTAESSGAELRDASSAINPNWIRKQPLEQTELGQLLLSSADSQALQQSRIDDGLSVAIEKRYAGFFVTEAFENRLCGYSYANVNSSDEFALERLFTETTGDASAASSFHASVQAALGDMRQFKSADLVALFGQYRESVGAVMTIEPQINVNFVDPFVLKALLSYPAYKIDSPTSGADAILSARRGGELSIERVAAILGLEKTHALFTYLGDDTWFWRITVKADTRSLEAIYARPLPIPGEPMPSETDKKPVLVSWRLTDE